jgi:hypothetical protein
MIPFQKGGRRDLRWAKDIYRLPNILPFNDPMPKLCISTGRAPSIYMQIHTEY